MAEEEERSRIGHFWLPDAPGERLAGELSFDDAGVGLQLLDVFSSHRRAAFSPGDIVTEVIFGELANPPEAVSVLGCDLIFPAPGWSSYHANAVLYAHTDDRGSLPLRAMTFRLTGLDIVFARPTHVVTRAEPGSGPAFTVSDTGAGVAECELGRGYRLVVRSGASIGFQPHIAFRPSYSCTISTIEPKPIEQLLGVAQTLRQFVEILSDSPQRLTDFSCTSADEKECEFHWPALERRRAESGNEPARREPSLLTVPELLDGDEMTDDDWSHALDRMLRGWLGWREQYSESVDNLMSRVHGDASDVRQRFLHSFAAVEKYGQSRHGANVDDAAHEARVRAVLDALPNGLPERAWVKSVLQPKKRKGQARLVHEVVTNLPGTEYLVEDAKSFATEVAGLRGARSHGDASRARDEEKRLDTRLRAVLLLAYFADCDRTPDELDRIARQLAARI